MTHTNVMKINELSLLLIVFFFLLLLKTCFFGNIRILHLPQVLAHVDPTFFQGFVSRFFIEVDSLLNFTNNP